MLVEPSTEDGLGNMVQSLGRRYVQYINQTYKRTGTLWEGRFKSSLVSKDEYLLACSRYIELNPVRAKIVEDPRNYPWSSFGFRGEGKSDTLLDEDSVYLGLGKTKRERELNYKKCFLGNIPDEEINVMRTATQKGGIIGTEEFISKISRLLSREVVLKPRGRPKKSL
jgi:putative transposase